MTITNDDALVLFNIIKQTASLRLGPKVSWAIAKNLRLLKDAVTDIEAARTTLIKKYVPEGQDSIDDRSPNWAKFITDIQTLMAIQIDINIVAVEVDDDTLMELDKLVTVADNPALTQLQRAICSLMIK